MKDDVLGKETLQSMRSLGRILARELTEDELQLVTAAKMGTLAGKGYTDSGGAGDCDQEAVL